MISVSAFEYIAMKDRYEEIVASILLSGNTQQLQILNVLEFEILRYDGPDADEYLYCIEAFRHELNRRNLT